MLQQYCTLAVLTTATSIGLEGIYTLTYTKTVYDPYLDPYSTLSCSYGCYTTSFAYITETVYIGPYIDPATYPVVGVIFGLLALSFIIVAIVYFQRQKKRKAWYSRMATHYRNGGLPPCTTATGGVGDNSVNAQLLPNSSPTESSYVGGGLVIAQLSPNNSPTESSYPRTNHENPTQFGVHGNLPTVPLSNATGITGYTVVHYHTADTIPPIPVTQAFSPQSPHSQYPGTTGPVKPHNSTPNVHHSILYAPFAASSTQISPPLPTSHGAPATHSRTLADGLTYNTPPKGPEYAEASVPAQAPEYAKTSVSAHAPVYPGGTYNANENTKGKEYENTVLPTGNPEKQSVKD